MDIDEKQIKEIVQSPANYPDEFIGACLDVIIDMNRQAKEAKQRLVHYLLKKMKDENATKLHFVSADGKEKTITIKKGSVECVNKDPDEAYKERGFDPLEIGGYVFKPSWSLAKEARKTGGVKQLIIDELFQAGNDTLEVK